MQSSQQRNPSFPSTITAQRRWLDTILSCSFLAAFGREHSYYRELDKKVIDTWQSSGKYAVGIVTALRDDIKGG